MEDDLLGPKQSQERRNPDKIEEILSQQFYVDDFIASAATPEEASFLLQEGIERLGRCQMKLGKIQSNCPEVRNLFPDSQPPPPTVDLSPADTSEPAPQMGHSLGLQWDTTNDLFRVKMEFKDRPKTKRGLLGYIMSPYDPFGQVSPAMLSCKLLQREIFPPKYQDPLNMQSKGWDDAIPSLFDRQWADMLKTVQSVGRITSPRSFYQPENGRPTSQQLFGFSDASDSAICYVIYLRSTMENGNI